MGQGLTRLCHSGWLRLRLQLLKLTEPSMPPTAPLPMLPGTLCISVLHHASQCNLLQARHSLVISRPCDSLPFGWACIRKARGSAPSRSCSQVLPHPILTVHVTRRQGVDTRQLMLRYQSMHCTPAVVAWHESASGGVQGHGPTAGPSRAQSRRAG